MRSDLNYLRAQINPHFLFNTFNNLYSLALDKSEKTPEIILKLSDMMDYMLYESNETEVLL
ncbi:MAG: histidine kinase, partial [Cyclobacteriaceae bacterium]|nr:histidine kinase [Cyclobacteriaceae bacterium]